MNFLSFSVTLVFYVILVEKQQIEHAILSHCLTFIFSTYVPIQVISVGVERSYGTPTGTSRQLQDHWFSGLHISSETPCLIRAKFHIEPPWVGGSNVYSRHLGYITKMAVTW